MKNIKFYMSFIAIFALLFTSCSKDENSDVTDSDKATLSFGAIVADLAAKSTAKQSDIGDMPVCSDDTPAFVKIVLMQGDNEVVGTTADPYRVDLVAGQVFTEEDEKLELVPGNYSLNHFSVYNADGDLLWLAPRGGDLAAFVDNSLPINIELGAGVKKYVDVSVLCFDNRDVNLYGYQFFELDITEAFEFCFFANYCTPQGRHYPARYSVDISIDGNTIYDGVVNNVGRNDDGDLFADALCFALPDLDEYDDNEEYIDYTITLLDWTEHDDAYGDVGNTVITGSLSRAEIMANFDGDDDVEYEHLRFGCGDDDQEPMDSDGDGVIDEEDDCPNTPAGAEVDENGCPIDSDDDGVYDGIDECPNQAGPASNKGCPVDGDADGDGVVDSEDDCPDTPAGADVDENGCPIDSDGDGVYDGIDECPGTESGVEVDAVGCPVDTVEGCENLPAVCELEVPSELGEYCFETYLESSDNNGWVTINSTAELELLYDEGVEPEALSTVSVALNGTEVTVTLDSPLAGLDRISAYAIEIRPSESGSRSTTCWESKCANVVGDAQLDPITNVFTGLEYGFPFYVRISTISCFTPDVQPGE